MKHKGLILSVIITALIMYSCGTIGRPEDKNTQPPPPPLQTGCPPLEGFMNGVNLGNGLDAPYEGAWGVVLTEKHFALAAESGLDHVRLPVRFSAHALAEPPYTIDEDFFRRVDWAVDMAEKYQLSIIVDMHHYNEIMADPAGQKERFLGLWSQIAERYKDRPDTVAFELLNEPSGNLGGVFLNEMMEEAFLQVRKTNPRRLIFISGPYWNAADRISEIETSYMDENTIVTFHSYQPMFITHQQAPWMGDEWSTGGLTFPGPPDEPVQPTEEAARYGWVSAWFQDYNTLPARENPGGHKTVYEEFGYATAFYEATGQRVHLGEFGCIDFADEQTRYNYIKIMKDEAERRGIGWCLWDDGGHNRAMIPAEMEWIPVIEKALFGD